MTRQHNRRPAVSLLMVMMFVAVASVMGIAVLNSTTLQTMVSSGQSQALQADALAESGVNLGLYYLQNINDWNKCPLTLVLGGKTYTKNGISLGSSVPGTVNLSIVKTGTTTYRISSTGRATQSTGTVQRTIVANVSLNYFGFGATLYATSGSTVTIPSNVTITGDVAVTANSSNNGTITGTLYSSVNSGTGTAGAVRVLSQIPGITPVPALSSVNHFGWYTYNGVNYSAHTINSDTLSGVTLAPTETNPAGVFVHSGDLTLNGNVTVNGTLVITGGDLLVTGKNNTIKAADSFPALIVDDDIKFSGDESSLAVSGLVWVADKVCATGSTGKFSMDITGALISPDAAGLFSASVTTNVLYDRRKASVPGLIVTAIMPTPTSLTVDNWTN